MLTPQDFRSATAERIRQALRERLATHRTKLEGDSDDRTSMKVRGRIAELKELLALLEAAPAEAPSPHAAEGLGAYGLDPQP
jgi:hypothetical protein